MDFEHPIHPFLSLVVKATGSHSLIFANIVNFDKQIQSD